MRRPHKSGRSPDRLPFGRLGLARNKKCDCGSGKKAKICCMPLAKTLYHNQMEHNNTKPLNRYDFDQGKIIRPDKEIDAKH